MTGFCRYFLMALLMASMPLKADNKVRVIGSAYDPKSGALFYTEEHVKPSPTEHQVVYKEVSGEVFAVKELRYHVQASAPSFKQTNERNGEITQVERISAGQMKITYISKTGARAKVDTIDVDKRLIIDAGFDPFVRENWQTLDQGDDIEVDFLVATRQFKAPFLVEKTDCIAGVEGAFCLLIKPNAWWVKLAVDPIFIAYDRRTQNLLRYLGRGNISEANGDYLTVDIRYLYPERSVAN